MSVLKKIQTPTLENDYIYIYMRVYVYICIYVCMHMYVYVCMWTPSGFHSFSNFAHRTLLLLTIQSLPRCNDDAAKTGSGEFLNSTRSWAKLWPSGFPAISPSRRNNDKWKHLHRRTIYLLHQSLSNHPKQNKYYFTKKIVKSWKKKKKEILTRVFRFPPKPCGKSHPHIIYMRPRQ